MSAPPDGKDTRKEINDQENVDEKIIPQVEQAPDTKCIVQWHGYIAEDDKQECLDYTPRHCLTATGKQKIGSNN